MNESQQQNENKNIITFFLLNEAKKGSSVTL